MEDAAKAVPATAALLMKFLLEILFMVILSQFAVHRIWGRSV
jgi:hypothetical protein